MEREEAVRPARLEDAPGIGAVQVASWRSTYPGMLPDAYLVGLSGHRIAARWRALLARSGPGERTFVAEDAGGRIVGFGTCGSQRTELPDFGGEFYTLYVLDDAQGRGLGRRLIGAMAGHLLDQGVPSALVWVLHNNPSRWFYERLGGRRLAEQAIDFAGASLSEIAYGWPDLMPLARMPADPPA